MELRPSRHASFFQSLFSAIASVSHSARTIRPVAALCLAVLTLGVVYLTAYGLKHAWAPTNGSGTESSFSLWPTLSVHAQGGGPTFTTFEAPGAGMNMLQGTTGAGINAAGDIAGVYITAPNGSTPNLAHGFVRIAATGAITDFDAPGAGTAKNEGTLAFGIDTAGDVAGMYADSNDAYHGFVRTATTGVITPFDAPGAPTAIRHRGTVPFGMNAGGDITGQWVDASAVRHGFMRAANGTMSSFDAPGAGSSSTDGTVPLSIASTGNITGYYKDAGGTFHGFIRAASNGVITASIDAPGASSGPSGKISFTGTLPTSIDTAGDIAGIYADSNGLYHGFIRAANGTFTAPIDAPGATKGGLFPGTLPASMNDSGVIAGVYEDAAGLDHGFVRAADGTFTAPLDAPNASTASIGVLPGGTVNVAINASGVITGGYFDKNGVGHGFSLTLTTQQQAATPTFNPPAGTYATAQSVTISDTTPGAVIHFTTDMTTPDATSPVFSNPIAVNSSETIEAIAIATGFSNSAVASAAYVINQPAPDFTVSVNPTTLTIAAGKSGQATFTVTPENGFNSQVGFACSGLPAEASCSFNPPNVTPKGAAASTTLTVSTMAPSGAVPVSMPALQRPFYTLQFSILGIILAVVSRRMRALRKWQPLVLLSVFIVALGLLSCGGGGNSGTPTGTTIASVSAAAGGGGLNHGAALKIIITH